MDFTTYNVKRIRKYLMAEMDADCESALPGGAIFGNAIINLKDTMKHYQIQLHGFSSFLIMNSESSKNPNIRNNVEDLIHEEDLGKMDKGKKVISLKSKIPLDSLSSLDIDGHDFGEFKNQLIIKGILTGSFMVKKSKDELAQEAALEQPQGAGVTPAEGEKPVNLSEPKMEEKKSEDGKNSGRDDSKLDLKAEPEERKTHIMKKNKDPNSRETSTHNQEFFVLTFETEIEIDNDTDGEKIYLERPVQRSFTTKSGGMCCKSATNVTLKGRILNTNIKSYSDEIKFNCFVDLNKKSGNLKHLIVMTCFGVTPIDKPKPDLTVWRLLSSNTYFPSKNVKNEDFDVSGNYHYIQNEADTDSSKQMGIHYVSNTERLSQKKNCFHFPFSGNKAPFILHSKIKIGRQAGLSTFYSRNSKYKTVYALKIYPVIKGSVENGKNGSFQKIGEHLTIPFSVKAKLPPSPQDMKVIKDMYDGLDYERLVNKEKLGKMRTMVNPSVNINPMMRMHRQKAMEEANKKNPAYNQVAPANGTEMKNLNSNRSKNKTPREQESVHMSNGNMNYPEAPVDENQKSKSKMKGMLDDEETPQGDDNQIEKDINNESKEVVNEEEYR